MSEHKDAEMVQAIAGDSDLTRGRLHSRKLRFPVDVRAVREKLGMSEEEFAKKFAFNPVDLDEWETGKSRPDLSTRILLTVLSEESDAVLRAMEKHEAA